MHILTEYMDYSPIFLHISLHFTQVCQQAYSHLKIGIKEIRNLCAEIPTVSGPTWPQCRDRGNSIGHSYAVVGEFSGLFQQSLHIFFDCFSYKDQYWAHFCLSYL